MHTQRSVLAACTLSTSDSKRRMCWVFCSSYHDYLLDSIVFLACLGLHLRCAAPQSSDEAWKAHIVIVFLFTKCQQSNEIRVYDPLFLLFSIHERDVVVFLFSVCRRCWLTCKSADRPFCVQLHFTCSNPQSNIFTRANDHLFAFFSYLILSVLLFSLSFIKSRYRRKVTNTGSKTS